MKLIVAQLILMLWVVYSCTCFFVETKTINCHLLRSVFTQNIDHAGLFASPFLLNNTSFIDHGFFLMPDKANRNSMIHHLSMNSVGLMS